MLSDFYCAFCGYKLTIPRLDSKQREKYHVKTMHCFNCNHDAPFIEIRGCDTLTDRDLKVIRNGILPYYFNKYGYDFLKLLFYIQYCEKYTDFKAVVDFYIHPYRDMTPIFEQERYLTVIVNSIQSRNKRLFRNIKELLEKKTVFLTFYES